MRPAGAGVNIYRCTAESGVQLHGCASVQVVQLHQVYNYMGGYVHGWAGVQVYRYCVMGRFRYRCRC